MKLQERDESILWTLDKLGCATTSQLRRIHKLGSERNAQRVLARLYNYTITKRLDENVFYLNRKGLQLIGSDKKITSPAQLEHTTMRNEVYIAWKEPKIWHIERPIPIDNKPFITPDVTFGYTHDGERYLLEVDCSQRMVNNRAKIDRYKELKKIAGKRMPTLVWITKTPTRVQKLQELCKDLDHVVLNAKDLR